MASKGLLNVPNVLDTSHVKKYIVAVPKVTTKSS